MEGKISRRDFLSTTGITTVVALVNPKIVKADSDLQSIEFLKLLRENKQYFAPEHYSGGYDDMVEIIVNRTNNSIYRLNYPYGYLEDLSMAIEKSLDLAYAVHELELPGLEVQVLTKGTKKKIAENDIRYIIDSDLNGWVDSFRRDIEGNVGPTVKVAMERTAEGNTPLYNALQKEFDNALKLFSSFIEKKRANYFGIDEFNKN